MNECDKCKLKVLIKRELVQRSPKALTSNEICNLINKYDYGFRVEIDSYIVASILYSETNKPNKHFMENIVQKKKRNGTKTWTYVP